MSRFTRGASRISAVILIAANAITMAFSTLLFSFGLWAIASPGTLLLMIRAFGTKSMKVLLTEESVNLSLGISLAVLSCFLFFISFMGVYGAISCSQFLLFMYSTLVLLLLLLECAVFFYFSTDLIEKGIREQDGQLSHALRIAFDCCEFNTTIQDGGRRGLPWSCCGVDGFPDNCTVSQSFKKDCKQVFTEWLDIYDTAIYAGLAVLHVVLSSCSLLRRACCASRSHT